MLQNAGDASLQERQVHETDAAEVRFLLVLSNDFAKPTNDILGSGSETHDTLVFGGDGQVVQGEACQVTSITGFLGEALSEGCEHVVLSAADHGDTVLLVSDIAQFVDSLGGGGALFSLRVEHGLDQLWNVVKGWGLGRGALGRGL